MIVDDGVPGVVDEGDGVVAAGMDPAGDAIGAVVVTGEPAGEVVIDVGELAGVGDGGEVGVDTGELARGEVDGDGKLFDGYGDRGDSAIPFP